MGEKSNTLTGLLVVGLLAGGLTFLVKTDRIHLPRPESSRLTARANSAELSTSNLRGPVDIEGAITNKADLTDYRNSGAITNANGRVIEYKRVYTNGRYTTIFVDSSKKR